MTQLSSGPVITKRGGAASNIYTVLVVVAFLALLVGIGFVVKQSGKLFGTSSPFEVVPKKAANTR